jgi:hypothetical protein
LSSSLEYLYEDFIDGGSEISKKAPGGMTYLDLFLTSRIMLQRYVCSFNDTTPEDDHRDPVVINQERADKERIKNNYNDKSLLLREYLYKVTQEATNTRSVTCNQLCRLVRIAPLYCHLDDLGIHPMVVKMNNASSFMRCYFHLFTAESNEKDWDEMIKSAEESEELLLYPDILAYVPEKYLGNAKKLLLKWGGKGEGEPSERYVLIYELLDYRLKEAASGCRWRASSCP